MFSFRYNQIAVLLSLAMGAPLAWAETMAATPATSESKTGHLHDIEVQGIRNARDEAGYDRVYDNDMSTVYSGKQAIERFKGAAPADVFKGMVGVQSGDARNSGALDPNIRGIQGQGRVPLTIDGTEQSITVWRGYNGANNRNYIDPMLIGGITVEKGPGLSRGVASSVGGGVAVKTLSADDILLPGKNWGVDIKVEGSNNAAKPDFPTLTQGIKVIPDTNFTTLVDNELMKTAKSSGQYKFGRDFAARIAAARRWDNFDVMAAFAWRKKGNHFAGKNSSRLYNQESKLSETDPDYWADYWGDYTARLAQVYKPGDEVPNTSTDMKSALLKATWRPSSKQSLELGLRHTEAEYGELMPSRVAGGKSGIENILRQPYFSEEFKAYVRKYGLDKLPQWPAAKVRATALNLEHKWNPDNPYIDLQTNLWTTRTVLDTHTSGGYPREAHPRYYFNDKGQFVLFPTEMHNVLRNTSLTNSKNNRWGLTGSNKFNLTSQLDLTVGGSYQHETLSSDDSWYKDPQQRKAASPYTAYPREGWRKEWDLNFKFDWRPADWLLLSAGARKNGYSSYDEQLQRQRLAKNSKFIEKANPYMPVKYYLPTPQDLQDAYTKQAEALQALNNGTGTNDAVWAAQAAYENLKSTKYADWNNQNMIETNWGDSGKVYIKGGTINWKPRDDGKFYRADSPIANGSIAALGC